MVGGGLATHSVFVFKRSAQNLINGSGQVKAEGAEGGAKSLNDSKAPKYENPGHHDPKGGGPNPYNSEKSVLPENHEELW